MKHLLFLLFASCGSAMPWNVAKEISIKEFKSILHHTIQVPEILHSFNTALPIVDPAVRIFYGRTSCNSGPNPVWIPVTTSLPREGVWFRLGWAIEAVATPAPPTHSVAMLVATRPRREGLDLVPHGLPGCMLLVEPELILRPTQNPDDVFYYNPNTGLGYIQMLPLPGMRGVNLFLQLLVETPSHVFRLSSGLELVVGS